MMKTKQIHFFSGIFLSLFIGVHLLNHFYSLFGLEAHIRLMDQLRVVYRNPLIETLLLLAVLAQVVSGIKLVSPKRKSAITFYERVHINSGLYLSFFLLFHVGAVLGGRMILQLDTNIYFGVAGLNTFPFNLFFISYYGLAILSFFAHAAAIHQKKMTRSVFQISPTQQANIILVSGVLVMGLLLFGLTNKFAGVAIPADYHILIGK